MRRFLADMNPTVRGLLAVAAVAAVVVLLSLETAVSSLWAIARIAFFLAIAFFVFLMWRERRSDIDAWSPRAKWTFYGAAVLAIVDLAAFFLVGASGPDALAFVLVLAACVFAMVRVWRDEHAYS